MKKVALGLHDFSVVNNRLLWLRSLKEHFPDFKVSLFTVPVDKKEDWGPYLIRDTFLLEVKNDLDWIQIIPHGLNHSGREVGDMDYAHFKHHFLPAVEQAFNKDGLPFSEGFCAPHFKWNQDVVAALNDIGWWGAVDRDKEMPTPHLFYRYNYKINEPFWESTEEVLKLHGHIYGTSTDLGLCFESLLKLPKDTQWFFVTDFLEENDGN